MGILTDEDVFGSQQAAPAGGGRILSDADVFGPDQAKPATQPLQTSRTFGDVKGALNRGARNAASIADLVTTGPLQMGMDVLGQLVGRVTATLAGGTRADAEGFGKELGQTYASNPIIDQPLRHIYDWVAKNDPNATDVDAVMGKVSDLIHKGGEYVEKHTGGVVSANDVDLMSEALMTAAGGKAQAGAVGKLAERMGKPEPKPGAEPVEPTGPVEPPQPETPAAQAAKRDVKADIEAATGVSTLGEKAAKAQQEARRAQARAAFKDDPQYADYLRNYAEEEALQRTTQEPLTAPGGLPGAGPRAARTGLRDAAEPVPTPMTPEQGIETGAPSALDTALQKVREGRSFDLTPEERIRLRNQGEAPQIEMAPGYRPRGQRGSSSQQGMETLAGLSTAFALSSMLRNSDYTLKTLERLPQNRVEFTRQQVLDQLRRPDVSKAEKDLVEGVLGDKEKISAKELVGGFREAAKGLELAPKLSDEYASYGLDAIGRFTRDMRDTPEFADRVSEVGRQAAEAEAAAQEVPARTTIYRNSELNDTNNHFDDPRYFAHTRSFDENGVRHVVEIQSDVAQHAKVLPEAERAQLQQAVGTLNDLAARSEEAFNRFDRAGDVKEKSDALKYLEDGYAPDVLGDFKMRMGEKLWRYLSDSRGAMHPTIKGDLLDEWRPFMQEGAPDRIYDWVRNAEQDAIKQKSADGLYLDPAHTLLQRALENESRSLDLRASELEVKLGTATESVRPLLKNWYKRIIREELARVPGEPVRFATADTVAKVEGWPDKRAYLEEQLRLNEKAVEAYKRDGGFEQAPWRRDGLLNAQETVERIKEELKSGNRFSPEHQSIYDRYKSDIEKFLKNDLGAKPVTDAKGHTWLEVPARPRGPTQMFGRASTGDVAALAAFVGGAAAMQAWSDNPSLVKDIVAGLMASGATRIRPGALADSIRNMRNAKPLASIGDIAIERESAIRLAGLDTTNVVRRVTKLVPDEVRREKVHEALDTGDVKGLKPNEKAAYDILRTEYDRLGKIGLDAETLKNVRSNYATHMWKMDADFFERLFGRRKGFGTSPNTPYSMHRAFRTMAEGEAAGLKPVSKDAAFVFATYANSLAAAVENGRMLKTLRTVRTPTGDLLVQKTSEAPPHYVTIQNPQMRGLAVHPEIAPQMRFIFENPSAAGVGSALEIIADVTKRSAVSASLFHAKALTDVLVAAVPGKVKYFGGAAAGAAAGYALGQAFDQDHAAREAALGGMLGFVGPRLKAYATGRSAFLEEVAKGSNSPFIVRAVKSGLVFGAEKGPLVVDDAGRRFYDAMQIVQKEADRIASPVGIKAGKGVEAYIRANHYMDDVMWGRLHPAMKLEVWSKTSGILRQSSIERNAKNPKARLLSQAEADQIASKYTNDLFGGLNWTRLAMEAQTRLGRSVAQELYSPRGRRAMRIMLFAPDWTLSTARSALAAVDKDLVNPLKWGSVVNGMFKPMTRGDLARQYVARSALYYLVVGDAINYAMSGHHLWENDDKVGWSFIDWGDGRRMQFSKHIMETPHWFEKPVRQAVGKLGYVPKEAANQLLGTEYLAPQMGKSGQVFAGPKMKDPSLTGRVGHALGGLTPIPLQGPMDDSSLWGFFGMPIYGQTREQADEARRQREDARRRAR